MIDEEGAITNDLVILIVLSQGQFFGHGQVVKKKLKILHYLLSKILIVNGIQEDLVPIEDENSGKVCASCIVSDIDTRLLTLKK